MVQNFETGEIYLHYFVPVAVVEDMSATPALLAMNRGGAKDSDFFFSLTQQGELIFLLLETKAVDRQADAELIFWRIFNWWEFLRLHDPWTLPEGVCPDSPRIRHRNRAERGSGRSGSRRGYLLGVVARPCKWMINCCV